MKSRYWVLLIALALVLCLLFSALLLLSQDTADRAEVWSDGVLLYTLPLSVDTAVTVESRWGMNTVTVRDGKIGVTEATCPDHYCMHRGFRKKGLQIVCLPNRLTIQFVRQQEVDGIVG